MQVVHEKAVSSTSDLAIEAAYQGAIEGTAFRSDVQLQGRGRQGRNWASPEGNLYFSVVLRPVRPMLEWPTLSLLASIAVADALTGFKAHDRVSLKWPNDVLLDGHKCAGLLLEVADKAVILGCGVNCNAAPDDISGIAAGALNQMKQDGDRQATPDALFEALEVCLIARYKDWQSAGFECHRQDWLEKAAYLGDNIVVSHADGSIIKGVFEGIDDSGGLCLRGRDGSITVLKSGDVVRARAENKNGEDDVAGN